MPVCARDTGIYLGVLTGVLFLLVRRRFDSDKPPSLLHTLILCVWMLPMPADGIGSYLGLYETNNGIRLVTGVFFGLAVPVFLVPAAHFKVYRANTRQVLKGWGELGILLAAAALVCFLVLSGAFANYLLLSSAVILSFLFLIGRVCYTVIARLRPHGGRRRIVAAAGAAIGVLTLMYTFSALVLQPIKILLLSRG